MLNSEEAAFEAKTQRWEKEHHGMQDGRNFLAMVGRYHGGDVQKNFDIGVCRTFPNAPGSFMCGACKWEDCELRRDS
jgi:hypothetical protein